MVTLTPLNKMMKLPLLALCLNGASIESRLLRGLEGVPDNAVVCLNEEQCKEEYRSMDTGGYFYVSDYTTKGCFKKNNNVYYGTGGTEEQAAETDLPGVQERVYCTTLAPTVTPSKQPTAKPVTTSPSKRPTQSPSTADPSSSPSEQPTPSPTVKLAPNSIPATVPKQPSPAAVPVEPIVELILEPTPAPSISSPTPLPTPQSCQIGSSSSSCSSRGQFCLLSIGRCNSVATSHDGFCVDVPTSCTNDQNEASWCGCDGVTYNSDCEAFSNGVNLAYMGKCVTPAGSSTASEHTPKPTMKVDWAAGSNESAAIVDENQATVEGDLSSIEDGSGIDDTLANPLASVQGTPSKQPVPVIVPASHNQPTIGGDAVMPLEIPTFTPTISPIEANPETMSRDDGLPLIMLEDIPTFSPTISPSATELVLGTAASNATSVVEDTMAQVSGKVSSEATTGNEQTPGAMNPTSSGSEEDVVPVEDSSEEDEQVGLDGTVVSNNEGPMAPSGVSEGEDVVVDSYADVDSPIASEQDGTETTQQIEEDDGGGSEGSDVEGNVLDVEVAVGDKADGMDIQEDASLINADEEDEDTATLLEGDGDISEEADAVMNENYLGANDMEGSSSSSSPGVKLWAPLAAMFGVGGLLVALYAIRAKKRRRQQQEDIGAFLDSVPPVSSVAVGDNSVWGDENFDNEAGEEEADYGGEGDDEIVMVETFPTSNRGRTGMSLADSSAAPSSAVSTAATRTTTSSYHGTTATGGFSSSQADACGVFDQFDCV